MARMSFFDPLYDYVTFEEAERDSQRAIFAAGWNCGSIHHDVSKHILPFLSTLEFNRLSFLRQSNLAFLLYPSSTHTRFAHAIGCCYLGYLAARQILVTEQHQNIGDDGNTNEESSFLLNEWLINKGWKEEFLLALLLHDIGHFACSHALESNHSLWKAVGFDLKHEDVAHQFLYGKGPAAKIFREKTSDMEGYPYVSDIIKPDREEGIDPRVISFLIRGKQDDISTLPSKKQHELRMLHELTSGLLDLDRIDHYRRDSYFSGIKFASNLNFSILLQGLSIKYDQESYEIRLSDEAIGHALTLLHAKERLIHDCFENPPNIAYEIMLHHAFNLFVFNDRYCEDKNGDTVKATEGQQQLVLNLLLSSDEELLIRLAGACDEARKIVYRIRNRDPYVFIGRKTWVKVAVNEKTLRSEIAKAAGVNINHLAIKMDKEFNRDPMQRPKEWLHLGSLYDQRGRLLEKHEEYSQQIKYFKHIQDESAMTYWVFTNSRDREIQNKIKAALKELTS